MAADTTKSGIGCFAVVLWGAALFFGGILALIPAVGPILGVAVLVGAGVLHWQMNRVDPVELEEYRARKAGERPGTLASHAVVADPLRSAAVPRSPSVPPVHIPPSPSGVAVEPWPQTRSAIEVVGEAYRDEAFRRLFQGVRISDYDGADMTLPAALVDDSGNPYDSHAVAIWVGSQHVGYLDRDTARIWHPTVAELAALDQHLTVPSRVWASTARGTMSARVTLYAPACDAVRPANELPEEPHVVLPVGSTIQVTKEDEHMDVLSTYATGGEKPIAVTLHAIHEIRPRSAFETVEVRLDGERVGILTPTQAGNLLPLVKHVEDRGQVTVARATLKGNRLKADITLHVVKSQDADPAWLDSLGPARAPRRRAVRPEYEWDD